MMQPMVERVAEELRESRPECDVIFAGAYVELPGDEALLRQALVNLTRNAAEAAQDGAARGALQFRELSRNWAAANG